MPVVARLIVLLTVQGALFTISAQTATPTPTALQGNWNAKPLVTRATAVPGGQGELLEFGDAYVTDTFLAFWARTGPKDKDWVLFSWKDDKLTRVLQSEAEFVAPDSRKVRIHRKVRSPFGGTDLSTPIHAGKRLLYFSPTQPDHLYAWDGDKLVKVLASGDEFAVGEGRYVIKRARVLDVGADGKALVYWDSAQQNANGWALHDGTSFTPLWKEGDEMPGLPGVRIENLSAGKFCAFNCVPPAKLLEDGSLLASLRVVAGGKKRLALFRVAAGKSEEIVADGAHNADNTIQLGQIYAATPRSFVMDATKTWISSDASAMYSWERPLFLFFDAGKYQVLSAVPEREAHILNINIRDHPDFAFEAALILAPESPRALLTVIVARKKSGMMTAKFQSYPGLYFWDGEKLSSVAWEEALGLSPSAVVEQLQQKPKFGQTYMSMVQSISLRSIPGPIGGVSVRLPLPADSRV
ncbi:MAG: hypothetical protein ABSC08_09010, partial [Bryobacteraceae bacterium]